MNLTIEQMREIVDEAPEGSQYYCTNVEIYHLCDDLLSYECCISLSDLRATLADHDRTDYVSDIANHISPTTVVIER